MVILEGNIIDELTKEHLEEFGVEPVIIGLYWDNQGKLVDAIYDAIEDGKPYDELDKLTPEEREAYENGELQF